MLSKKHHILKRLASSKYIVILHPDKGSGTVILNRDDYINSHGNRWWHLAMPLQMPSYVGFMMAKKMLS